MPKTQRLSNIPQFNPYPPIYTDDRLHESPIEVCEICDNKIQIYYLCWKCERIICKHHNYYPESCQYSAVCNECVGLDN